MRTFTKLKLLALSGLTLTLFICANESNAAYVCAGKIDAISQPYEGSVQLLSAQLYGDSTPRTICNLKSAWNGVDPATCKGWLAALLSAKAMSSVVNIQYNDTTTACPQQAAYGNASAPWAIW
ncbi:hypothetical protein [Rhizobacter sp. SG703]|uniref:hypothetical protein n=1 Tax=Rhizobacter sp. SG703 TaxID=2587140 RepID=UPI0014452FB8|nr:hypothetical protein [Rhizobacter sp. SG703]NKI97693.1 hypothetical protein [Rhizobacter sp. SG703]